MKKDTIHSVHDYRCIQRHGAKSRGQTGSKGRNFRIPCRRQVG